MPPEFTVDESLREWDLPAKDWLVQNGKEKELDGLASAVAVFNPEGRVLIIQRAAHDSMPNKWELPGGAVDDEDLTVLHGAARELFEEAGLIARRFTHAVFEGRDQTSGHVFPNSTKTKMWCRFTFHAEVESCNEVRIDPEEHQQFVWASEAEIREQQVGDHALPITHPSARAVILEAFRLRHEKAGHRMANA